MSLEIVILSAIKENDILGEHLGVLFSFWHAEMQQVFL